MSDETVSVKQVRRKGSYFHYIHISLTNVRHARSNVTRSFKLFNIHVQMALFGPSFLLKNSPLWGTDSYNILSK